MLSDNEIEQALSEDRKRDAAEERGRRSRSPEIAALSAFRDQAIERAEQAEARVAELESQLVEIRRAGALLAHQHCHICMACGHEPKELEKT